ncbi:MAG: ATP-dependent zinc protease [Nitrospirales bacterium]|nr:ATP-dependent zinc protease [Nitrospirales bacterium]
MWLTPSRFQFEIGGLCLFIIFIGSFMVHEAPALGKDSPQQAGWIERVTIYPGSIPLEAKLDTGAFSASLHAENVSTFSRKGESWVKFDVPQDNGQSVTFERKVHRTVKIKRHKQKATERPVVLLGICIGNHYEETEVNLADRSNYKYPLLIGRLFLADRLVVDASRTHLLTADCPDAPRQ